MTPEERRKKRLENCKAHIEETEEEFARLSERIEGYQETVAQYLILKHSRELCQDIIDGKKQVKPDLRTV